MKTLSFEGSGFEYFKIWIVNILLVIVTLGIYYPWAKVRNRRYFYANTTLEDRNFEYHATGKQLFVSYLIALALFIGYVVIQQISIIGSIVLVIALFLSIPWIVWRSMKFNMRMTSFSNVHFSFDGALGGAYVNFMVLPFLFFLSLYGGPIASAVVFNAIGPSVVAGIVAAILVIGSMTLTLFAFSFMQKRSNTYIIEGIRFGQGEFSTNLNTKTFAGIYLKAVGISFGLFLALMMLIGIFFSATVGLEGISELQNSMKNPDEATPESAAAIVGAIAPVYLGVILLSFFVIAYTHTQLRAYIFAQSTLDNDIRFNSSLKAMLLAWVMISNFFIIIFTAGIGTPWTQVRIMRFIATNTHVDTDIGFDQYISQKQDTQSSLGEQIGDAFDVDVGVAL